MEAHRHLPNGDERSGGTQEAAPGEDELHAITHGSSIRARRRALINLHEQSYHVLVAKHAKPQSGRAHPGLLGFFFLDFASRQTFARNPIPEPRGVRDARRLHQKPLDAAWRVLLEPR
eukprot:scaffold96306_cov63-Phaeocystis_antarctica.AAC.2